MFCGTNWSNIELGHINERHYIQKGRLGTYIQGNVRVNELDLEKEVP